MAVRRPRSRSWASATTEITILGAGPAGIAAARLLSTWNHRVHLISKPPAAGKLAVSIPPSTSKLFDLIGVTPFIDAAGFVRSTGNTVWWGSEDPRVEPFASGARGWQVELKQLAAEMRASLASDRVRITTATASRHDIDRAQFVLDCTGRAGVVAREKGVREYDDGPRTVALVGEWRTGSSWDVPDDTHTVIESYRDGWVWSVPVAPGVRHVSAMVDPQRSALAREDSPRDVYLAEIAKTRQFKRLLSVATLLGGPWGWDATPFRSSDYAADNWILVGDAASFIDPLSSAGVKKALASAWLAAVAAHTCAVNPSMRAHALAFHAAREREVEREYSEAARMFLSEAAQQHREAFWADRMMTPDRPAGEPRAVQAAFEALKAAAELRLRPSRSITIAPRPYVDGREIVLGPHVVAGDGDPGTRYLYNIDVPALIELAPTVSQVADLLTTYGNRAGQVDLHDFLMALSTAVARGWLVRE